jgi:hypothetical protein
MVDNNTEVRQAGGLSLQNLRLDELARILSALGPKLVSVDMLQTDIDDGAPVNADGTLNLIHYLAWVLRNAGD